MEYLTSAILWLASGYCIMSFIEWYMHKFNMHRPGPIGFFEPMLYHDHQKVHHPVYRDDFEKANPEEHADVGTKISIFRSFRVVGIPLILMAYYISWLGAAIWSSGIIAHALLWNYIHAKMHSGDQKIKRWWWYRVLYRHHLLHHRYPKTNMNVICLGADNVFGTTCRSSEGKNDLGD